MWIISIALMLMIYILLRRCYIGLGSALELVGAVALVIILIGFIMGYAAGSIGG